MPSGQNIHKIVLCVSLLPPAPLAPLFYFPTQQEGSKVASRSQLLLVKVWGSVLSFPSK